LNNSFENIDETIKLELFSKEEEKREKPTKEIVDDSRSKSRKSSPVKRPNSKRRKTEVKSKEPKKEAIEKVVMVPEDDQDMQMWTEKYQFKDENEIVTNNSQLERLKEWLNNWKTILSRDNNNNSSKSKLNEFDSDSDYSCDSECSESESSTSKNKRKKFYSNAILLTGPYGCGKTSSIYSVAKQLGFKVIFRNN
jgi:flagellar biosynthesis GTPase FlhF